MNGFWNPLSTLFDQALTEGFVHPDQRFLVLTEGNPRVLLERVARYTPPETRKWIGPRGP